jgi:uncharacterized protein (DUF2336 family)
VAHDRGFDLHQLVDLARERNTWNRERLLENISDVFLSDTGRLSDRERALIGDILKKLLTDMEMAVRQRLAERFAATDTAPPQVVEQLANDSIEVARPILQKSRVLSDPELIEVIKWRGQEHQIAIAMRQGLSEAVSQNLIDYGNDDVITALIENHDTQLSQTAINYLVEESRRVDQFQEPLLRRPDLPARLAHRMFWWVSAALRKVILTKFTVDAAVLDDALRDSARSAIAEAVNAGKDTHVGRLIQGLVEANALDHHFLLQALRGGKIPAFVAGLAHMAKLDAEIIKRAMFDAGGETLAIICKTVGMDRNSFASVFLLSRQGAAPVTAPKQLQDLLGFFDALTPEQARSAVRFWRMDNEYLKAIASVDEAGRP